SAETAFSELVKYQEMEMHWMTPDYPASLRPTYKEWPMANAAASGQIWPFFYSRNKVADYTFLLLPEPLAADPSGKQALMQLLRNDGAGTVQHRDLEQSRRRYEVYYVYRDAK